MIAGVNLKMPCLLLFARLHLKALPADPFTLTLLSFAFTRHTSTVPPVAFTPHWRTTMLLLPPPPPLQEMEEQKRKADLSLFGSSSVGKGGGVGPPALTWLDISGNEAGDDGGAAMAVGAGRGVRSGWRGRMLCHCSDFHLGSLPTVPSTQTRSPELPPPHHLNHHTTIVTCQSSMLSIALPLRGILALWRLRVMPFSVLLAGRAGAQRLPDAPLRPLLLPWLGGFPGAACCLPCRTGAQLHQYRHERHRVSRPASHSSRAHG